MRFWDRLLQVMLNVPPRPAINFTGTALTQFREVTVEFLCDNVKGATIIDDDVVQLYNDDGPMVCLRFKDEAKLTELLLLLKERRPCPTGHQ